MKFYMLINKQLIKFYIIRQKDKINIQTWQMQPFSYTQHQGPIQYVNPSSSKALTKLKNDKLIPVNQINYQSGQPLISYPPKNVNPFINYNGGDSSLRNNQSLSKNQSMVLRRQESNNSGVGFSQSSQLTMSQHSLPYTQPSPPQPTQTLQYQPSQPVISMNNQNINDIMSQPPLKPLSAFNRTNNQSTNGETRIRSNSANVSQNLKFNQTQSENRIFSLQNKLNDYNQQIITISTKLSEKQAKITQLQKQLSLFRNKSAQFQIKVKQFGQKTPYLEKRVKQLQSDNQKIKSSKLEIEQQNQKNMEKVMTLQSNLDKILQIKNHQIQSLNQSCTQLNKSNEQLHLKYQTQIRKLTQKNQTQQLSLKHNKTYFQNLAERIKQLQAHSQAKQKDSKKINDQAVHIQSLYSQNQKLKFQLQTSLEQLSLIKANYLKERQQTVNLQQQLNKIINDYDNAKKIGQQQLQFLQSKLQEAALQKERFLQQIQLTKAIAYKRNMIFERKIIYDLKAENDKLWAKLIDKSQNTGNFAQNDPGYWTFRNATSHSRRTSHQSQIPLANPTIPSQGYRQPSQGYRQKQKAPYHQLEEQYRKFVQYLQQQQQKAQGVIVNLNNKQTQNNIQDIQFYKRKCINLQKMVEQHLKINISLKQQLDKSQIKVDIIKPADAQINFLKSELEKQQLMYNTLQRTFDIFKTQYQLKFKSAQARVDQIESQQDKSYGNVEEIKKQLSQAHYQILKLSNQNFAMKNKLQQSPSQQTKYQNLYLQLKSKMQKGSPISHFTLKQQPDHDNKVKRQMDALKKQYEKKQQQYQTLSMVHQQNCQAYEQQLKMKENQIDILRRDMDKLSFQFQSGKIRYGPMINDIDRLQRQLTLYKKGTMFVDKRMASYYTALIRAKLLQFDAFLKQIIQINKDSRSTQQNAIPQSLKLIQNSQKTIQNCLAVCSQLEVNIRQ